MSRLSWSANLRDRRAAGADAEAVRRSAREPLLDVLGTHQAHRLGFGIEHDHYPAILELAADARALLFGAVLALAVVGAFATDKVVYQVRQRVDAEGAVGNHDIVGFR